MPRSWLRHQKCRNRFKPLCQFITTSIFNAKFRDIAQCEQCCKSFNDQDILIQTTHDGNEYHYACYTQTQNFIIFDYPCCTEEIWNYNELTLAQQSQLNEICLPKLISIPMRYQLKLLKCDVNQLHDDELKDALKQRDINQYDDQCNALKQSRIFKRKEVIKKLIVFLQSTECERKQDMLVTGYCKDVKGKTVLNVPFVIKQIIFTYCAHV